MANTKIASSKRLMTDYLTGVRDENAPPHKGKLKKESLKVGENQNGGSRKSLKVLQPSSNNQGLTRPGEKEKEKPPPSRKRKLDGDVLHSPCKRVRAKHIQPEPVTIYEDPSKSQPEEATSRTDVETQTETQQGACVCTCHEQTEEAKETAPEKEAYDLMCSETVPEGYWKVLAEERRSALDESLQENCELHSRVQEQVEEIERLTELANQAEYFASMLRMATEDVESEEESSTSEQQSDESTQETSDPSKQNQQEAPSDQSEEVDGATASPASSPLPPDEDPAFSPLSSEVEASESN